MTTRAKQWEKLCRICLHHGDGPLFTDDEERCKLLKQLFGIDNMNVQGYPNSLCCVCEDFFTRLIKKLKTAKRSELRLLQLFSNSYNLRRNETDVNNTYNKKSVLVTPNTATVLQRGKNEQITKDKTPKHSNVKIAKKSIKKVLHTVPLESQHNTRSINRIIPIIGEKCHETESNETEAQIDNQINIINENMEIDFNEKLIDEKELQKYMFQNFSTNTGKSGMVESTSDHETLIYPLSTHYVNDSFYDNYNGPTEDPLLDVKDEIVNDDCIESLTADERDYTKHNCLHVHFKTLVNKYSAVPENSSVVGANCMAVEPDLVKDKINLTCVLNKQQVKYGEINVVRGMDMFEMFKSCNGIETIGNISADVEGRNNCLHVHFNTIKNINRYSNHNEDRVNRDKCPDIDPNLIKEKLNLVCLINGTQTKYGEINVAHSMDCFTILRSCDEQLHSGNMSLDIDHIETISIFPEQPSCLDSKCNNMAHPNCEATDFDNNVFSAMKLLKPLSQGVSKYPPDDYEQPQKYLKYVQEIIMNRDSSDSLQSLVREHFALSSLCFNDTINMFSLSWKLEEVFEYETKSFILIMPSKLVDHDYVISNTVIDSSSKVMSSDTMLCVKCEDCLVEFEGWAEYALHSVVFSHYGKCSQCVQVSACSSKLCLEHLTSYRAKLVTVSKSVPHLKKRVRRRNDIIKCKKNTGINVTNWNNKNIEIHRIPRKEIVLSNKLYMKCSVCLYIYKKGHTHYCRKSKSEDKRIPQGKKRTRQDNKA